MWPCDDLTTYTRRVVKHNKRLYVERVETGAKFYTPPDHVHVHNRQALIDLAASMDTVASEIKRIVEFEAKYRKKKT